MNIIIGGVNGAGKTTVLEDTQRLRPTWSFIKGSKAFMEWLGFPGDYERLRSLEPDIQSQKLADFMQGVIERGRGTECQILDSHFLNLTRGKIETRTGPWLKNFDAIVLITAPVDTVIERLKQDNHLRDRALFSAETLPAEERNVLKEYIDETEKEFNQLAAKYNLPSLKIENLDRTTSAKQLVNFVESLPQKA